MLHSDQHCKVLNRMLETCQHGSLWVTITCSTHQTSLIFNMYLLYRYSTPLSYINSHWPEMFIYSAHSQACCLAAANTWTSMGRDTRPRSNVIWLAPVCLSARYSPTATGHHYLALHSWAQMTSSPVLYYWAARFNKHGAHGPILQTLQY